MALTFSPQRTLLRGLFDAAVAAADPARCLPAWLPEPPAVGRTVIVGAGKAAAAMAKAVEERWRGDPSRLSGLVVTRYGHGAPTRYIEVVEAAHPAPDAAGQQAAVRILDAVGGMTADDLVLVLLSGGGSALLAAPMAGIALAEKRAVTEALLSSGANIGEINCVRKHLSAIKGGRLALAAAPARVLTLAISDVPGDDLSTIASGPTVPDPTSCADALEIITRYGIELPAAARQALLTGVAETPKADDSRFARCESHIIATAQQALAAAAEAARAQGITPLVLGDAIEGEAREAARVLGGIALSAAVHGVPLPGPCVLLSGGETTVTVTGKGRGGRNAEFLLGLALALGGHERIHAIACDTDGIDGSEDNAGALLLPDTPARAAAAAIDLRARLVDNDAYSVFQALGDLVVTGPTRTNVNDFRAILIERAEKK
ncbi:MAG: hydroxypyruvate reductase [Rhodocyclales bacterium GWA2_65_20]|nr:MAG: hydroxypyruvate reductase [Rhodocyclales bacterium GWA2_65_20]